MEIITDNVDKFGFTMCDASTDEIVTDQKGVFRTNCMDWYVCPVPDFEQTRSELLYVVSIEQTSCKTYYPA